MDPSKRYVIAHIQMPIEISETEDYRMMDDRMTMNFDVCTELPPVQTEEGSTSILNTIQMLFEKQNTPETNHENVDDIVTDEQLASVCSTAEGPFITDLIREPTTQKKCERMTFRKRPHTSFTTRKKYNRVSENTQPIIASIHDID